MTCPKCGSLDIRVSHSSSWSDALQRVIGRMAFRCRKCRLRFYSSFNTGRSKQMGVQSSGARRSKSLIALGTNKRLKRRLVTVAIFAVAFLLFWIFMRYFTADRSPTQDSSTVRSSLLSSSS
jgi:preprotein translocase subunit SecG